MFSEKPTQAPAGVAMAGAACRWQLAAWLLVVAAVIAYGWVAWAKMGAYAGGSDSSGYANSAKLMLAGKLVAEQRPLVGVAEPLHPQAYVPLGFRARADGAMAPMYPLGLSALFAVASWGGSLDRGMALAILVMLVGSLPPTYRLARQFGLERGWALATVALVAACPLVIHIGLQAMSDVPAMFWTTLVLVLAWASGERRWLAVLAGVAVAVAVFIRPVNGLVLLPVALMLGFDWRRWLLLGLGGLPGALLWLHTNHLLFGQYVTTGYGEVGSLFSWSNVLPSLAIYAWGLPQLVPLAPFVVATFWPGARTAVPGRLGAALAGWVVLLLSFYAFYWFTRESWWFLRFVLPAVPALAVLAVAGLRWAARAIRGDGRSKVCGIAAAGFVAVALAGAFGTQLGMVRRYGLLNAGEGERIYPELCAWTAAHLPQESIVFCMQASGALYYTDQFVLVRWDVLNVAEGRSLYDAAARAGRPVYAVLFPFEIEEWGCFSQGRLPGRWIQVGAVRHATVWRLEDPHGRMP